MIRRRLLRRRGTDLDCREVGKVLQRYLDGDVDTDVAARIAAHLDDCRQCGLEYEIYARIKGSLTGHHEEIDMAAIARLRDFGRKLTEN